MWYKSGAAPLQFSDLIPACSSESREVPGFYDGEHPTQVADSGMCPVCGGKTVFYCHGTGTGGGYDRCCRCGAIARDIWVSRYYGNPVEIRKLEIWYTADAAPMSLGDPKRRYGYA